MSRPARKPKTIRPVRPNAGLREAYYARLHRLTEEMNRSVVYWLRAAYRANTPEIVGMAADESPARALNAIVRGLSRRWQSRFDDLAKELARWFATKAAARTEAALASALKTGGMSVKFDPTRATNDAFQAIVAENVALIRSIPQRYLLDVQGHVMRSVQAGRDLSYLTDEIEKSYGVARRRAALIARDQNNKSTAVLTRVRHQELGITRAQWIHSAGGKTPRPTHVKAGRDKTVYEISDGWYDPAARKNIWPGTEINCRCVSKPILPSLEDAA